MNCIEELCRRVDRRTLPSARRQAKVHQMKFPLMFAVLIVYILLGCAAFLFFERAPHEQKIRRWYLNHGIKRRQFARAVSKRIFNDTKTLLIIIDREQTERVQAHLVDALKQYEMQLDIRVPDRREWHPLYSLNFALSLLTTVGHGSQLPETQSGQIFAMVYSVIGVPFLFGTLALLIHQFILPSFQKPTDSFTRRVLHLQLALTVLVVWVGMQTLYLWNFQFNRHFWISLRTALFTSLTIQTPFFNNLPDTATLILLLSVIVTMLLSELVVFLVVSLHSRDSGSSSTSAKGHRLSTVLIAPPSDNDSSSNKIVKDCDKSPLDAPKFDVIVSDNASSNQLNVQKL